MAGSSNITTRYEDVQTAEHQVARLKRQYLTRFGWQFVCAAPCSYWMWQRQFGDKTVLVTEGTAIDMTQAELDDDDVIE